MQTSLFYYPIFRQSPKIRKKLITINNKTMAFITKARLFWSMKYLAIYGLLTIERSSFGLEELHKHQPHQLTRDGKTWVNMLEDNVKGGLGVSQTKPYSHVTVKNPRTCPYLSWGLNR